MQFNKDFITSIKDANPIEEVAQQIIEEAGSTFERRGDKIFAHHHIWTKDPNPGTALYITPDTQSFYCFSCHLGGDVISLVQSFLFQDDFDKRNINQFSKAIEWLANRVGMAYEGDVEVDDDYLELRIIYNIYNDFIKYACMNSFKDERKDITIGMIQERYPLTEDTIEAYKICYFDEKWTNAFYNRLLEDYTQTEIFGSGLFFPSKDKIKCRFMNRIIIPYLEHGDVVYMIGRQTDFSGYLNNEGEWVNRDRGGKFKKIPLFEELDPKTPDNESRCHISKRVRNDYVFGADSIKKGHDIVITEGIGDCLVLLQEGYRAISPVTTKFKNELLEPVSKKLLSVKHIYICNDSEVSGAGLNGAERMYQFFNGKGLDAKIVRLPLPEGRTHMDVAEFFQEYTKEDFNDLLMSAQSILELEIEQLGKNPHRYEVQQVWEKILNMNAFDRDDYQKKLAKQIGKSQRQLKDMFFSKKASETIENIIFEADKKIIPALDFDMDEHRNRYAYTTIWLQVETRDVNDEDKVKKEFKPFLVKMETSIEGKQMMSLRNLDADPLSDDEMERLPDQSAIYNRWRVQSDYPFSVASFLKSSPQPRPEIDAVFSSIYRIFDDYFWYPQGEDEKLIQTLYIMMTYFYQMFPAVPGLHLTGPKNSGKSNSLKVHHMLAFNAEKFYNPSEAAIFRASHNTRSTFIIEESEKLTGEEVSDKFDAILGLLRCRYKKGDTVPRMQKTERSMEVKRYDPYGPTLLGSIAQLQDAFASRCIIIECLTKSDSDGLQIKSFDDNDKEIEIECEGLRDKLYFLMLQEYANVWKCYEMVKNDSRIAHISNREREKYIPLFTMALWIDLASKHTSKSLFDQLIPIQKRKEQLKRDAELSSNKELTILQILYDILTHERHYGLTMKKLGENELGCQADLFYSKMNERVRANQLIKANDLIPRGYFENIIRKCQIWRIGEGIPMNGMIKIDLTRVKAAIDRIQKG